MGRTKGKHLKTIAKQLTSKHRDKFTDKFEFNKNRVREAKLVESSKEERNKLAGEITNLIKRIMRTEAAEAERQAKISGTATAATQ